MWKETKISPYYLVNENGDVKRISYERIDKVGRKTLVKEKIIKHQIDNWGYPRVMICIGVDKPIYTLVHRLVAETFLANPNNLPCINHKDENTMNNNIENLEWCSVEYNNNYGKRNERAKNTLIKKLGKKVIAIKDNKEHLFNSVGEASRSLNIGTSNIFSCLKGRLQQTGGYTFKEVI